MNIYMDNCCFNRILDDRSNPIIYLERNSVMLILELVEKDIFTLYGSQILIKEIQDTPSYTSRNILELMYSLCSSEIKINENIVDRAFEIMQKSNIRLKDSIHLACAEYAKVDIFLTVDKKFMNNANRIPANVKVMNPTKWIMEVIANEYNN